MRDKLSLKPLTQKGYPVADTDAVTEAKQFYENIPASTPGFFLKGAGSLDWGMKTGRPGFSTLTPLERSCWRSITATFRGRQPASRGLISNIVPLMPMADALMLTRGILRTTVPPALTKPIVMRCSGGPSILKELSNEELAVDIEDAIRMNVSALTFKCLSVERTRHGQSIT